jgi:hypothetical protein
LIDWLATTATKRSKKNILFVISPVTIPGIAREFCVFASGFYYLLMKLKAAKTDRFPFFLCSNSVPLTLYTGNNGVSGFLLLGVSIFSKQI